MAIVPVIEISQRDMQDPALSVLNDQLKRMTIEINRLAGNSGPIQLNNNIDFQKKYKVVNSVAGVSSLNALVGDLSIKNSDGSITIVVGGDTISLKVP